MAFSDIPVRANGEKIEASWFNTIRTELLNFFGGNVNNISANYQVLAADYLILVDASGGSVTLTMPDPSTVIAKSFVIIKIDSSDNPVILEGSGGGDNVLAIAGQTTYEIYQQYKSNTIMTDENNYYLI